MATESKELKGGRYVLVRKLGEGSQGQTFEAIDRGRAPGERRLIDDWQRFVKAGGAPGGAARNPREEGASVAIKCFRVGTAKAWKDVELAEREASTLASLDHPRLPKYYEHFEEDGVLYLVMEKIEGMSLASAEAKKRRFSHADVTRLLEDTGDALRYLHAQSPVIVHRDIKPGNVIRRPDGSYAIVDFGSVRDRLKPAGGSTVVGTFGYMAPEQFQGRASPKSDLYGVAATALAMLTGCEPEELPHEGLGIDVARAIPRGTPAGLTRALTAMLVPDPDRRVASIDEALALLHTDNRRKKESERPRKQERRTENRAERRARKRAERAERREQRALRRGRAAPLVPRMIARLGLLVAMLVVWVTVGLVTPLVLVILSLLFGSALRRAALACVRAARRSQAAIGRASAWLSGHRSSPEDPRVRIEAEPERKRIAPHSTHDEEADEERGAEADAWLEERLENESERWVKEELRRERMRLHARPPKEGQAKRRFWGR